MSNKHNTPLLICHEAELDLLLEQLQNTHQFIDVLVVDMPQFDHAHLPQAGIELRIIQPPVYDQRVRPSFLKSGFDIYLWLSRQVDYNTLYFGSYCGLAYFTLCHQDTSQDFEHLNITVLDSLCIAQQYAKDRALMDKQALQLSFLEKKCKALSHSKLPNPLDASGFVTVIITHFNRCDTIKQTLLSLVSQTLTTFEVIIVDDASIDENYQQLCSVADEFKNAGLTINLVRNSVNSGPSASRNTALSFASGEFVLFLDDDDVLAYDALQRLVYAQRKTDSDFVTCSYNFFYGNSYPDMTKTAPEVIVFPGAGDWVSSLFYNCVGGITVLYRKAILVGEHVFNTLRECGEEDWQLILKLLNAGYKSAYCPMSLLWYRNTHGSISDTFNVYRTKQNLYGFYQQLLPAEFAAVPQLLASMNQSLADKIDGVEVSFATLGYRLAKVPSVPIYIYGAGNIGLKVKACLDALGLAERLICFFDRNAKQIKHVGGKPVFLLDGANIIQDSIMIIASFSFIDEIEKSVQDKAKTILRLDAKGSV